MANAHEFSLTCTEMGPHEARLFYHGPIGQSGAMALESQLARLFGYFKYRRINLFIESPGGEIDGLEYVLRAMQKWAEKGRTVAVGTTFQCASAAAFLLAMGEWGQRQVDRSTFLLFHSARIDSSSIGGMTAAYSTNLSQALYSVDRKLLEGLVNKMIFETGSAQALADLVLARARYVDLNWKALAAQLTTFTTAVDGNRKPDWLKAVGKWARFGAEPQKFVLEMKKHLHQRLQRDVRMDLLEAFSLALLDRISGVVDAEAVGTAHSMAELEQQRLSETQATNDQSLPRGDMLPCPLRYLSPVSAFPFPGAGLPSLPSSVLTLTQSLATTSKGFIGANARKNLARLVGTGQ